MSDAKKVTPIRALRTLDVDGVRIEEGATAEIRAELVAGLEDIGACEGVEALDPPAKRGGKGKPG